MTPMQKDKSDQLVRELPAWLIGRADQQTMLKIMKLADQEVIRQSFENALAEPGNNILRPDFAGKKR